MEDIIDGDSKYEETYLYTKMEKLSSDSLELCTLSRSSKSHIKSPKIISHRSLTEIFPWIQHMNVNIRLQIMTDHTEYTIVYVLKQYNRALRMNLQNYLKLPNRCYLLSKNIIKTMLLLKLLNKHYTHTHDYLVEVSELLSIYTTLELKYSTKFEESKICAANRIALNYEAHLRAADKKYFLRVFMATENFYQQREIMRKIFCKYLKTNSHCVIQQEIPDETYVMYLISYKLWKSLEDDFEEKAKIEDIANSHIRPNSSLRKNPQYAPFIPAYRTKSENVTKYILSQNFCVMSLIKKIKDEELRTKEETERIVDLSSSKIRRPKENGKSSSFGCIEFPNVKLERPEVIASVDLTAEKHNQVENDLCWLDNLIHKVRSVSQSRNQMKVLETIILDDIDLDGSLSKSYKRNKNECVEGIAKMLNEKQIIQSNSMIVATKRQAMKMSENIIKDSLDDKNKMLSISESSHYTGTSFDHFDLSLKCNVEFKSTDMNNHSRSKCESNTFNKNNTHIDACGEKSIRTQKPTTETEQLLNLDSNISCFNSSADSTKNSPSSSKLNKEMRDNVESESNLFLNVNAHTKDDNISFVKKCKDSYNDVYKMCEENKNKDAMKSNHANWKILVPSLKTYSNRRKKVQQNDVAASKVNKVAIENNEHLTCSEKELKHDENVSDTSKMQIFVSESRTNLSMVRNETNMKSFIELEGDTFQELKKIIGIEDANNFIKNTAKKLTFHENDSIAKRKKFISADITEIKIPTDMENTLLDLPVFSSSEDEESCDSNILSILDESDNSAEPKHNAIMKQNSNDDTPVQKISPAITNSNFDYTLGTCLLQENNTNQLNSPPSVETDFKVSISQPNVIFSTSNCKLKNLHYEWIDPTAEFEENFLSVQQSEISSPPIEEFTKSDKTLFQTFLNKVNESVIQTNSKHSGIQPCTIRNTKAAKSTALKQKPVMCRTGFAELPDKTDSLGLLKFTPSTQRRKTVSFTDITDEKTKKPLYKPIQYSKKQNKINNDFWMSDITANGGNFRRSTFLPSCQHNTPSININVQEKRIESANAGMESKKNSYDNLCSNLDIGAKIKKDSVILPAQNNISKTSFAKDDIGESTPCHVLTDVIKPHDFAFDRIESVEEKSSDVQSELIKNLSPLLPNSDLREVLNDDRFLLYYDDVNRSRDYGTNNIRDGVGISSNSYYSNDFGFAVQNWLDGNLDKRLEGQTSLPLKKRRKLSQYSDNLSIKEEDTTPFLDSIKVTTDSVNKELISESISNSLPCKSYPSTPMLSIANFENMICFARSPRRQFKTPGQLKEIAPLNLQTLNILPSQHAMVSSSGSAHCSDSPQSVQTINIMPSHVNSNCATNVQAYGIIPSQPNATTSSNRNFFSDHNIYSLTSNIQPRTEIKSVNMSFDLNPRTDLHNLQAFALPSNSIQYSHPFLPNQQFTYSIQSNQPQNNINSVNIPNVDIQNMINLSNYHMNSQHLSNFLHNSQMNLQAKQSVLLNDIPCNLQINSDSTPQVVRQKKNNEIGLTPNMTIPRECNDSHNTVTQSQTNCDSYKIRKSNNSLIPSNTSNKCKQKKLKCRATDRITRSSNRTTVINYRDDVSLDTKINLVIPKKKRHVTSSRK